MLQQAFGKVYRGVRYALVCGAVLTLSACSTPSLNVVPSLPMAPTVAQVEEHLTCVLARKMDAHLGQNVANASNADKNPDYVLWSRLVDYNFLATMNLTLFVTQTQGVNPSVNFIDPLTSFGGPIKLIVETSNGITTPMNPTSNTNNLTLAVGFQLTGLQDHNFVQSYVVDMHRLYDAMYMRDKKTNQLVPLPNGILHDCEDREPLKKSRRTDGLNGDLDVEATLRTGLDGLQRMPYTPVTAGSAPASKAAQQSSNASVAQSSGASSFSEKVDFSLTWGANGGPTWTLLRFKGPGGGSGASGQLVNYSRQKQDTLISTFSATCKSDHSDDIINDGQIDPALYFEPRFPRYLDPTNNIYKHQPIVNSNFTSYQFEIYVRKPPEQGKEPDKTTTAELYDLPDGTQWKHALKKYVVTVSIPIDKTYLPFTYTNTGTGTFTISTAHTAKNAVIAWSGFSGTPGNYVLRGTLSDVQSGTGLGYIYVSIGPGLKVTSLKVSRNAMDAINADETTGPADYWASLPSCSTSGPFLPNGLTVLQQLPAPVSATFEQTR